MGDGCEQEVYCPASSFNGVQLLGKLCEGPTHAWAGVEAANWKMKMEMEERAAGTQSRRNRLVCIKD